MTPILQNHYIFVCSQLKPSQCVLINSSNFFSQEQMAKKISLASKFRKTTKMPKTKFVTKTIILNRAKHRASAF
jgi:hypothetical protein